MVIVNDPLGAQRSVEFLEIVAAPTDVPAKAFTASIQPDRIPEESQHRRVEAFATFGADRAKLAREFRLHVANGDLACIHDSMNLPA